jgi:hypothetical protein
MPRTSACAVNLDLALQFTSFRATDEFDKLAQRAIRIYFGIVKFGMVAESDPRKRRLSPELSGRPKAQLQAFANIMNKPVSLIVANMHCLQAVELLRQKRRYAFFNAPPTQTSGSPKLGSWFSDQRMEIAAKLDNAELWLNNARHQIPSSMTAVIDADMKDWVYPGATNCHDAAIEAKSATSLANIRGLALGLRSIGEERGDQQSSI